MRIVVGVRVIKAVSVGGGGGEAAAVVQVLVGFAPIGCRRGGYVWKGREQRGKLEFMTNTVCARACVQACVHAGMCVCTESHWQENTKRKEENTLDMMHSLQKGAVVAQTTALNISASFFLSELHGMLLKLQEGLTRTVLVLEPSAEG